MRSDPFQGLISFRYVLLKFKINVSCHSERNSHAYKPVKQLAKWITVAIARYNGIFLMIGNEKFSRLKSSSLSER